MCLEDAVAPLNIPFDQATELQERNELRFTMYGGTPNYIAKYMDRYYVRREDCYELLPDTREGEKNNG